MQILKIVILFFIFIMTTLVGKKLSKRYVYRVEELEELKNALNIFKTKIKFTYDTIPEIFDYISNNTNLKVSKIFKEARNNMKMENAGTAWENAIETVELNLNNDDKNKLKTLSKLLGQTDIEGQIGQIDVTQNFLENQIIEARIERQKNEKLYTKLATSIGLAIVIILF